MAQSLNITIPLKSSQAGLTLKAQLFDEAFAPVGSPITSGFSERLNAVYGWHYAGFPDDFVGGVDFIDDGTEEVVASIMLNAADFGATASVDPLESLVPGTYPAGSAGAALGRLAGATVQVINNLTEGGDLYLFVNDAYNNDFNSQVDFPDSESAWPDLTGQDVRFFVQDLTQDCEVIEPTGPPKIIRLELTSEQTSTLNAKKSRYALKIVHPEDSPLGEQFQTILEGWAIIKRAP